MVSEAVQMYVTFEQVCSVSTQHHSGAGSCKYLEGPYGSNMVYHSCPQKPQSLGMGLDKELITKIVAGWYDEDCPIL